MAFLHPTPRAVNSVVNQCDRPARDLKRTRRRSPFWCPNRSVNRQAWALPLLAQDSWRQVRWQANAGRCILRCKDDHGLRTVAWHDYETDYSWSKVPFRQRLETLYIHPGFDPGFDILDPSGNTRPVDRRETPLKSRG